MNNTKAMLSHEFNLDESLIYLNHAAVGPWPRRAAEAARSLAEACATRGAFDYPAWLQTEARLRERLARLINTASVDDIALLKNTSEGLSVVAHGLSWAQGDNVVISNEEFPSNRIVWESLASKGVSVREVDLGSGASPEDALLAACDARTRILSISAVEYASGLRIDLTSLGAGCRERDIAFCVDAIQGLGIIPVDIEAMNIDFLMADAHKWLLGPEGIAVFYCAPEWRESLSLHQYGWHMVEKLHDFDQREWVAAASARRFECGSPNMLGIHVFEASLSLLQEIGIDEVERHVLANTETAMNAIKAHPDLELLSDDSPGRYAGICTFRHRNKTAQVLYEELMKQKIYCAPRGGGIRFSPHCHNDATKIRMCIEAMD